MSPSKQKKKQPKGDGGNKSCAGGSSTTAGQSTTAGPSNVTGSPNANDTFERVMADKFRGLQENIGALNTQMASFIRDLRRQNAAGASVVPSGPPDMEQVASDVNAAAMVLYEWIFMYDQSLKSRFHRYVLCQTYTSIAAQLHIDLEGVGGFLQKCVDTTMERDTELAAWIASGSAEREYLDPDGI